MGCSARHLNHWFCWLISIRPIGSWALRIAPNIDNVARQKARWCQAQSRTAKPSNTSKSCSAGGRPLPSDRRRLPAYSTTREYQALLCFVVWVWARPRDQFATETIGPFPAGGDPLEAAGQTVFSLVHRAARAEENTQHALGMAHKFSLQLLEAQERIATLEAEVGCSREQVYRAQQ